MAQTWRCDVFTWNLSPCGFTVRAPQSREIYYRSRDHPNATNHILHPSPAPGLRSQGATAKVLRMLCGIVPVVCTCQSRRRRLVCLVLGSAGAGRGQAMGRTGICSACYAIDQDRRRRGWRRQHLAQPRSRTGRALRTAVRWPGYRPRHPSHRGPRARSAHATTTRTGIRGEQLGGQTDPGSGDSP